MKVLHIAQCAGGVERYLSMVLPLLTNKGIKQILVCSYDYKMDDYRDKVEKIIQMKLTQSFNPINIIKATRAIRQIIREYNPDIVYCHSSMAGGLSRLATIGLPIRIVYNPHGWAFNMQGRIKSYIYQGIEKILAHRTHKIVCISEAERNSALKKHIVKDNKLVVIPNGINIASVEEAEVLSRKDLNIPEDALVIGMVGRISPQKAPDTFIQSARLIKEKIPNAYFMIVGDGELRSEISKYAKENELDLYITGWTDNPYAYMKMFDIGLLLSRWEGFGLAIVEYMAAHINFVSTRVDAIPTIVKEDVDGILVDVDSVDQVRDAVWKIYTNTDMANKLRQKAYQTVCEKYDVKRVAEHHFVLFHEILKEA